MVVLPVTAFLICYRYDFAPAHRRSPMVRRAGSDDAATKRTHKRSPCCIGPAGSRMRTFVKVRQKRAFLLFPERMEKQRRVEKYAFELVFCDCLFCEFPEKSGVKLIGKLGLLPWRRPHA